MNELMTRFERKAPVGSDLPVLITPARSEELLLDALARLRTDIEGGAATVGGVLLRGFRVPAVQDFRAFAAGFGHPLLSYEFGSTPRTEVGGGVYTSTEYPAPQSIPLHNEQAYTREWPMKIWFHCVTAAREGGETPIADSRAVYRSMPTPIRERFEPGILYVRNYGDFDVPWQKVFSTDSRTEVEAFCRKADIRWEWKSDGDLRTSQLCQATEVHPVTGETVWFNQSHLFHVSNLQPEVRESLEELLGVENLPRNTFFADGLTIPDSVFDEACAVFDSETVLLRWEEGDVPMLLAHACSPFKGPRKVIPAMAQPHGNLGKF